MSSPLDLTGNAHEDDGAVTHRVVSSAPSREERYNHNNKTKARRDKRHVQVEDRMLVTTQERDVATSAPRAMVNYFGDLAFLMLFNFVMLFFGAIARGFSLVFGNTANYLSPAEENQILHDMPIEQRQQQRELHQIDTNQKEQSVQIEDLRKRIQKLEARRKERAKQS